MGAAGHAYLAGLVESIVDWGRLGEIAVTSKALSRYVDSFSQNIVVSVGGLSPCWNVLAGRNASRRCRGCLAMRGSGRLSLAP